MANTKPKPKPSPKPRPIPKDDPPGQSGGNDI